jgi:hypothetical protein
MVHITHLNAELNPFCHFIALLGAHHGPGSSVGIATEYGLEGPGIESRWGRDFSHTSRPALGYRVFPGGKAARRGADHLPPSSADLEN